MPMPEVRKFPGYGIVYPDGKTGMKVVRTYTEAPKRIYYPDGSRGYTTPPPVIHELYGGGFAYADGSPVRNREHLENITDIKMKDRGLKWFDQNGVIPEIATAGVPELDPERKAKPPETIFVLSSDPDFEKPQQDPIIRDLDQQENKEFSQVLAAIQALTDVVKEQGEQIQNLKKNQAIRHPVARKKRSQEMKEKWKDPAFRAEMLGKNPMFKKGPKGEETSGASETSQTV